jgi:hypothetical protein
MDDTAGEAGRNAVVGRTGRVPPAALNQLAASNASASAAPNAAALDASTIRRGRRGRWRGSAEAAATGGGGAGVVSAFESGGQSRCREQPAHQLSIA